MRSGGGSVAFCSSAVAQHGIPNHEAIAAAKAGVVGESPIGWSHVSDVVVTVVWAHAGGRAGAGIRGGCVAASAWPWVVGLVCMCVSKGRAHLGQPCAHAHR